MGLLYISGQRLHDDDQELIAKAQSAERRSRFINTIDDGENYASAFDAREESALNFDEWRTRLHIRAEFARAMRARRSN